MSNPEKVLEVDPIHVMREKSEEENRMLFELINKDDLPTDAFRVVETLHYSNTINSYSADLVSRIYNKHIP